MENLKKSLEDYQTDLYEEDWNSTLWKNCLKKMEKILKNVGKNPKIKNILSS